MSAPEKAMDFQAYVCAAILAFIFAVAASLKDPLPQLTAWQGAPPDSNAQLSRKSSESGVEPPSESLTPIWTQSTGQDGDLKDAVGAPQLNAAALALARFPGGLPPSGEHAPLPGAAQQAAAAAAPEMESGSQTTNTPAQAQPAADQRSQELASVRDSKSEARARMPAVESRARSGEIRKGRRRGESEAARAASNDGASPSLGIFWKAVHSSRSSASPAEAAGAAQKAARMPRHKHRPLLRRGRRGALTPPKVKRAPTDNPWDQQPPKTLPNGQSFEAAPPSAQSEIEDILPPDGKPDKLAQAHWHSDSQVSWYHDGTLWGREQNGHWTWLEHSEGRWWLWPSAKDPVLVWHEDHWWWQSRGTWFVLHDGGPWVYRYLNDWQQDGLAHQDGSRMIFEGGRVGVIEPGRGARVYDSDDGSPLDAIEEARMPARNHLSAPSSVTLPR